MGSAPSVRTLAAVGTVRASSATEKYDISPSGREGIIVVLDVTTASGYSATVSINGKDDVSGKTWVILAATAITAAGTKVIRVRPGLANVNNVAAGDVLPHTVEVQVTHTDGTSITYSLSAILTD